MNQPQRKPVEMHNSAVGAVKPRPVLEPLSLSNAAAMTSPARALQAKLSRELQPTERFADRHMGLTAVAVFVAACAGTWVFGALLYLQV